MKKIVVLDLDREEFRFAVGGVHRRKVSLLGGGSAAWQSAAEGAPLTAIEQGTQIKEKLKEYKLGKAPAILLVDRSRVEELNLELPPVPDAELPQLVQNQALLDSPGLTDETIIDFVPDRTESLEAQRKIVAFALSPKVIENYKSIFQQAGLQLTGIQYRPYAATVLVRQSSADVLETTSLVVTLYKDDVELTLLDGEAIPLSRQVRLPGSISDERAVTRLLGEIRRTMLVAPQHLPEGRQITDIRLQSTGESADNLGTSIHSEFNLPVFHVNPLESEGVTAEEGVVLPPGGAALLGALQLAACDEKPPIDFLKPRKPVVKKSNTRTLVLAALFLAMGAYFGIDYLQQEYAKSNEGLNDLKASLADLKKRLKDIDKERKLAMALNAWESSNLNWLDEMRELSVRIPSGQDVTLFRMTMSPGRGAGGAISFSAAARTPDAVVALEKGFRDERHNIYTPGITQRSDKNYPWGFESTLTVLPRPEKSEEPEVKEKKSVGTTAATGSKEKTR